jgi:parvulin-like peptidyl-prolyl isomerase
MPPSVSIQRSWPRFAAGLGAALATCAIALLFHRSRETSPPALHPPPNAVARIGSSFITQAQLQEAVLRRNPGASPTEDRNAALEDQIRRALLFAEAERSGFTQQPEVQDAWRSLVIRRYEESLETLRETEATVTEADLAAYYQSHADSYATPEQRRLALIHWTVPAGVNETRSRAIEAECKAVHAEAVAGAGNPAAFAALAQKHSVHPVSRRSGGDVGWLQRAQALRAWPAAVVDAAFALSRDGEISPPIASHEGWYIVQRLELRPSKPLPLDTVRDRIRRQLAATRMAELETSQLAKLRALHGVEIYPDRVAEVNTPTSKPPRSLAQQPPHQPALP